MHKPTQTKTHKPTNAETRARASSGAAPGLTCVRMRVGIHGIHAHRHTYDTNLLFSIRSKDSRVKYVCMCTLQFAGQHVACFSCFFSMVHVGLFVELRNEQISESFKERVTLWDLLVNGSSLLVAGVRLLHRQNHLCFAPGFLAPVLGEASCTHSLRWWR